MSILDGIPDGRLGSIKYLKKGGDGPGKPVFEDAARSTLDFESYFLDFINAVETLVDLNANVVLTTAAVGAGSTAFAKLTPTTARPSHVTATVADVASGAAIIIGNQPFFLGGQNLDVSVKIEIDSVVGEQFTFGVVNAVNATNTNAVVTNADTPTFDAAVTDGVVFNYDTGAATNLGTQIVSRDNATTVSTPAGLGPFASQGAITGVSVANPASITSTSHGLTSGEIVQFAGTGIAGLDGVRFKVTNTGANTFTVPFDNSAGTAGTTGTWYRAFMVAATETVFRIITRGIAGAGKCDAYCFVNGGLVATVRSACRQNILLKPILRIGRLATPAKTPLVDFIYLSQERVGAPLF